MLTQQGEYLGSGEHFFLRPFIRAADVHILDKSNFRLHLLTELDQIDQLIVVEPTHRHRVEL